MTNPLFAPFLSAVILGIGGWVNKIVLNRITTNAQIKIKHEAEKIKFEIQRKYLLTEIKTRNLIEIYPKLHDSVHEAAGPYVTYFVTILDQVDKLRSLGKEPDAHQLCQFFEDYWPAISSENGSPKTAGIQKLNNGFATASLFISDEVSKIVDEMKKEIMNLFKLIRHEIENGTYKTYSEEKLLDLLNRANLSISSLTQNKGHLAKKMNRELDPDF